jgi:hypothetical protein
MENVRHDRVKELEKLVSSLRHELRGVITPAVLIADRLLLNNDPAVLHSGTILTKMVERILEILDGTYEVVPPLGQLSQPLEQEIS